MRVVLHGDSVLEGLRDAVCRGVCEESPTDVLRLLASGTTTRVVVDEEGSVLAK